MLSLCGVVTFWSDFNPSTQISIECCNATIDTNINFRNELSYVCPLISFRLFNKECLFLIYCDVPWNELDRFVISSGNVK